MKKLFRYTALLLLSLLLYGRPLSGQIYNDSLTLGLINDCVWSIYDCHFTEAGEKLQELRSRYPDHPALLIIKALITYWENFPLTPDAPATASFEHDLRQCIEKCDSYDPLNHPEYLLTTLCARGFLLLHYSDNDLSQEVMPLAAASYKYLRRSFDFTGTYPDFYYFTGLYNYYREAYPEKFPIYRTFIFVFPRGDKAKGLEELQKASESSILLESEAASFLYYLFLYFENNIPRSAYFSRILHEQHPGNKQFRKTHIVRLMLGGKYNEAEILMKDICAEDCNLYFRSEFDIIRGLIQEKKYKNYNLAEKLYLNGLKGIEPYGNVAGDFATFANFGLSRISGYRDDRKLQRYYRKRAYDLTSFRDDYFANE